MFKKGWDQIARYEQPEIPFITRGKIPLEKDLFEEKIKNI